MTDFWKKVEKVAGIVIGVAGFIAVGVSMFRSGRPVSRPRPGPGPAGGGGAGGGGGVWFVGTGQTKKPGSWSSRRHK